MKNFSSEIVWYCDDRECVAELYYSDLQWAQIFFQEHRLRIQFYAHPHQGAWELLFEEAVKTFENAKEKLLSAFYRQSNSCVNPEHINEQAQVLLEKITSHPCKQIIHSELNRFGKVMDIYAPGLGGVRYTVDEEFIGFLEPLANQFRIAIASLPDREYLVAEILYSEVEWAEISQEQGDALMIRIYPHPREQCWDFSCDEALQVLMQSKFQLQHYTVLGR